MLRVLCLGAALALAAPAAMQAQDAPSAPAPEGRTLADLRTDLRAVAAELRALRAELNASGAEGFRAAGGDSAIDRMNAMEREITRLTGETERLKHRIDGVTRDGTNRIGDIEFRLCEMEEGCDLSALTTPMLGEVDFSGGMLQPALGAGGPAVAPAGDAPLTAQEQVDLDRARAAMQDGDFLRAADLFGRFAESHAGSPAATEARYLQGAALDSAGDPKAATAAWLQAFAAEPAGPRAPDALLGLSRVSAAGRPASEGCVYLGELASRFAGTPQADEAARRMVSAGCRADAGTDPADGG
ncbi:tol-pal system protein [Paracoccus sp. (in: a-proteobacteria)]|uniref:tol-pal system protein n=1 Tax=Paracoccus sp. TaxID=267 RepID=UPI0026DF6949|nr:tol-pal system protein [Paracoccus sp. (in: a-proteobacteria)]MDO5370744.1 tol-pal system protein [Paracoccus sp. (in: a-proteobacteria)]